jgi:hypothetical protein
MGMAAPIYYTADMARALPDDQARPLHQAPGSTEAVTMRLEELFRPV